MARKARSGPGPYVSHLDYLRDRVADAGAHPHNLAALRGLTRLDFHPKVTFFVGENGSGKSTLLEAIAVECGLNPEGGSRNFHFATNPERYPFAAAIRLAKTTATPADSYFLRAESFYNVATEIDRLGDGLTISYGGKSLHAQSHGESFLALFENRLGDHGLYLMDEPESALSPKRQLQFLSLMHEYVKDGGQLVIATHSPIIMAYPEATIYQFTTEGVRPVGYEETEHYQVTSTFLSGPRRFLKHLLADAGPDGVQ